MYFDSDLREFLLVKGLSCAWRVAQKQEQWLIMYVPAC